MINLSLKYLSLKNIVLSNILFVVVQIAFSQEKELRFTYLNTNNGLSNNSINCIMQDDLGFMWIGTMDGLNRYDGYYIKTFKKSLSDSNSLADNMIFDLYTDNQKQIWIGTHQGLCRYNRDLENFTTYILDTVRFDISVSNRITGIGEDSKQNLYAVTELGTIFNYNRNTLNFENDTHNFLSIRKFLIDKEDNFWLGGIKGLYYYNKSKNEIRHFKTCTRNNKSISISNVNTIFEEGDTIWIGTIQGRIYYILKQTMEIKLLDYDFENTYYIADIYKDNNGLLYFSTTSALFVYNKTNNSYKTYKYEKNNPNGLNSGGVTKVFEDRQGNFWVGTMQGGLNIAVSGKSFNNYNTFSKCLTLDFNNVNYIMEDSFGRLWLGSFDQGISVIDQKTGKSEMFVHNPKDPKSLHFGTVFNIFEDSKKNIWVGTYVGLLQKFNPSTKEFISYSFPYDKSNPRFGFDVRSIIEDKKGNLWLFPQGSGIIKFNPVTGESKNFRANPENFINNLPDDWGCQIINGSDNYFWIATPSGLSRFDPEKEIFKNYFHNKKDTNSLCNNFINTIFEDSQHNLWIGTSFGLDLFDRENNRFKHFFETDGLPSNQIQSIIEYKPGQLWIGTSYGLSRMDFNYNKSTGKVSASFRNFDKSDNLQDFVFFSRSVCKTKDNRLIFGSENGIVVFSPDEINDNTEKPNVFLTNFRLYNKPVNIGDYDSLLKKSITFSKEIRLNHNQNFITFEFAAINYIAREKNKYRYMLAGLDTGWIDAGTKREASYTNLNHGEYIFKVQASNNDGYWNEDGISIKIIVFPPYYKTWWFRILLVFTIIFLVVAYYLSRVSNFKRQNQLLEINVKERTQKISEVNKELVEKNKWILEHNEEITNQNKEIYNKSEEILVQKELLEEQKNKVEKAYEQLEEYHTKLEELVEERTRELNIAKEKAEESDKLKSSFLANMSHEIRTPLNSIIGFTNLIAEENLSTQDKVQYKNIIQGSSNMLLKLISDIIDFSKIEAGHLEIFIDIVPMESVLNELIEIYNSEINNFMNEVTQKQIELKVNIDEKYSNALLSTDVVRLKQVFSILLNNAFKFTNTGYVEIGCRFINNENLVEFYVKDTGIGISPENLNIIFHRFRKADDERTNIYRGAGLGLSIAEHLLQLLGGKIWVESTINNGTTFYFTIPLCKTKSNLNNTEKTTQNILSNAPVLKNKTILIAEDDNANFAYIERLIRKTSANIFRAVSGVEVIEIYKNNPEIDLIMMDIKMPEMNGFEAFEKLQLLDIKIPVIAQTAYAFSSDIQMIKELGFNGYISKPINPSKLYSIISQLLS